jgi:S-disulfanyl-L-cysteine oxidoreductase SoxD
MARLPMDSRRSTLSLTCTASAVSLAVATMLGAVAWAQQPPPASPSGLGRAVGKAELQAWDISVGPDGAELPPGSGSATQGALVYTQRGCSSCHGPTGKEGPALVLVGGEATLATNYFPIKYWPFAPPIWDFIHRAMPYDRPGRLTSDEVYALVAFLLFRNDIIQEDDVMDARSLPKVQMPYRAEYKVPPLWTPATARGFKLVP